MIGQAGYDDGYWRDYRNAEAKGMTIRQSAYQNHHFQGKHLSPIAECPECNPAILNRPKHLKGNTYD